MRKNSIFYSGQRRSDVSNSYLLGNGYRGFNPILKRFTGQDNMSPFDAGGGTVLPIAVVIALITLMHPGMVHCWILFSFLQVLLGVMFAEPLKKWKLPDRQ